jgi:hypothetical protein
MRSPSRPPAPAPVSSRSTSTRSPLLHSHAILADRDQAIAIQADPRSPRSILDHPGPRGLLDLSQPTALLVVAILHFPAGDPGNDPGALVAGGWVQMIEQPMPM